MKKIAVVLAVCAITAGCATSQQQIDSHAPALDSWRDAPIEDFLDMQGAPTAIVAMGDHEIYRFDASKTKNRFTKSRENCRPTNFNEPINEYGQPAGCRTVKRLLYTVTFACTYGLVVVDDVIKDWSMSGNNCRMMTVDGRIRPEAATRN